MASPSSPFAIRGASPGECFEDDGETEAYRAGAHGAWALTVSGTGERLSVGIRREGSRPPGADRLTLLLPRQETRALSVVGGTVASEGEGYGMRCVVVSL